MQDIFQKNLLKLWSYASVLNYHKHLFSEINSDNVNSSHFVPSDWQFYPQSTRPYFSAISEMYFNTWQKSAICFRRGTCLSQEHSREALANSLTLSLKNKQNTSTTVINLKGYPVKCTVQVFHFRVTETKTEFQEWHFLAQGWVSLCSKPLTFVSPITRTALQPANHFLIHSDSYSNPNFLVFDQKKTSQTNKAHRQNNKQTQLLLLFLLGLSIIQYPNFHRLKKKKLHRAN